MASTLVIEPYLSVGPIRFGATESAVAAAFGTPQSVDRNIMGELNYGFEGLSVRFSKQGNRVVEVGLSPSIEVSLSSINLFRDPDAFERICRLDGSPFESVGFIVLLRLGITMTGFHDEDDSQLAVTAFARGRWDEVRSELVPFSPA